MPINAPTVFVTTLGCSKNQVDSDKIEAMLAQGGYGRATSAETADVVMVNTCAFIESARQESVDLILDMEDRKAADARLVVMGCMAQRYGSELEAALPVVDAVIGLDRYGEILTTLDAMTDWSPVAIRPRRSAMDILNLVDRPTPSVPYAYVKVAEGCDKTCAFCAIPSIRGRQQSRRPTDIRDEIVNLTGVGVSEIVIVSQDLAAYGKDIGAPSSGSVAQTSPSERRGGERIVDLLRFITDVDGLERLRLLYLHPSEIRPLLIEEMATNPRIADYFDLSLQHSAKDLLRSMRRPGSTDGHLGLIERIRAAAPEAALRSSFIVGYPGESEDDVEELAAFLVAAQLDWAGFFHYSPEVGTDAFDLGGRVDPDEIAARTRELTAIQDDITAQKNAGHVGTNLSVLVDQVEDGVPVGRSYREAPDIDGMIALDVGDPGEWVNAEITGSYGTDLAGRVLGPHDSQIGTGSSGEAR